MSKRGKIVCIILGFLFLLLMAAAIMANIWISNYLRSEDFRKMVQNQTGLALKLAVTYDPFKWSGVSVYTDKFSGLANDSDISAQRIRANFSLRALLTGAWKVEDLNIGRLDATFGKPSSGVPAPLPPEPVTQTPSVWTSFLPQRFEIGRIVVSDSNFTWGSGTTGSGVLQSTHLLVTPEGKSWSITARGGKLSMKNFPELSMDTAKLRVQKGAIYITDSQFRTSDDGTVQISGERNAEGNLQLKVTWQKVPVQSLLQEPWHSRLSGLLQGSANIESTAKAKASVEGNFYLSDGLLQDLPLQDKIASFTHLPGYRHLPIQQLSGYYSYRSGKIVLSNIIAESKGLLRVEGTCLIERNGELKGSFRVGVTSQSLEWLPGSQARVFTVSENGYLWTDVHLGGTIHDPHEDLSSRLIAAAAGQVIENGVNTGKGMIELPVKTGADVIKDAAGALLPKLPLP